MATGITPMDVVFSFDTTGSMSQALDEVKARVMDIIQKLQADIPGVRVGIIAHGDYCDAEHFYDIRHIDLSDIVADVVTFVNDTEGTGGGDIPECYELALHQAKKMSWRPVGRRILVMIGDAYPHEADYPQNVQNLDWRTELADLVAMNAHIYGVQVGNDELSTQFFDELASASEGQHLKLANMGRICEVIMGICYREQGPQMFQNYEAEIRHKEQEKFGPDLECVFGTLRHEVSRTSDVTAILDREANESDLEDFGGDNGTEGKDPKPRLKRLRSSNADIDDDGDQITGNGKTKLKQLRWSTVFGEDDDNEDYDYPGENGNGSNDDDEVKGNKRPNLKRIRTLDLENIGVPPKKRKTACSDDSDEDLISTSAIVVVSKKPSKQKANKPGKMKTPGGKTSSSTTPSTRRKYRERVSACRFNYDPCAWSPWHIAVCPKEQTPMKVDCRKWKSLGEGNSMWCANLLDNIPATRGCSVMFEMAVQAPGSHKRKVVSYQLAKGIRGRGVLALPWYRGVFRSTRPMIKKAAAQYCKIFLRWVRVKSRNLKKCQKATEQYNYAWKAQPPRLCF